MNTRLRSSLEDIIASARTPDAAPTTSSTIPQRFMPEAESLGNRHGWTRPLLAAAAAIVVIGGVSALNRRSNVVTVGSGPTAGPVTSTAPVDPSVGGATATTVASVSTTVPKTTLSRTLSKGLPASEDVRVMQQRLNDLHFDVGAVDGIFGVNTEMAVWAYQSLILNLSGKSITGKVTPELWDRMQDPLGLPMFRPDASSTHAEIFLPAQAMALYVNHELRLITHVSSGSGQPSLLRHLDHPGRRVQGVPEAGWMDRHSTRENVQCDLVQRGYRHPRLPGRAQEPGFTRVRTCTDAHQHVSARPTAQPRSNLCVGRREGA